MTFEYNNVTETKLEEFVAKFRKRAMNTRTNKIAVIVVSLGTSTRAMVLCRAVKLATRLQYEYVQVAVDRFCENTVYISHSATAYFDTSPFFLFLKRWRCYFYFKSTVSCSLAIQTTCAST